MKLSQYERAAPAGHGPIRARAIEQFAALPHAAPTLRDVRATIPADWQVHSLGARTAQVNALLVDDHELVRFGVKTAYAQLPGISVNWLEAANLDQAMSLYRQHEDVSAVLLDLNLTDCKGLQGLRVFLQAFPLARIAVFSGTQDEFVMRQARALGACAYVCKGAETSQLSQVLVALLTPADAQRDRPPVANSALFPRICGSAVYDRLADLGPRHLEILELVLSGCTNQEISASLRLSLGTVKNYVSSLLLALDVRSRSHLISLFA